MPKKLAAGNWKMNGSSASAPEVAALLPRIADVSCQVLLCPPATLVTSMKNWAGSSDLLIGGQDCHANESGAHTGDISAAMLADAGATHVILGHSERRADHGETDAMVKAKTRAAHAAGLVAIVCVGETEAERDDSRALDVVGAQIAGSLPDGVTGDSTVIAYEPVWAIGTGRTPTLEQIGEVHDFLRDTLTRQLGTEGANLRLLYGGSVKPGNAAEIFAVSNVDGALVGGASLNSSDFSGIIEALDAA
ncbi:triose-phosphate isomerase [Sedimentitalea todarodis]|uniref:Triosephosphate isomerase n=1 Tax=Sedimentitalea todarodis TaxID=1631240 RepID=A0ABU3VDE5_9RHOB|nr:triose-phosphate isomerase [Sedimentitalea todarodis]MDU9004179.1 triose-phosphate isomerase [Sedimentitalea todarodis]